jgi:trigger factor
MDYRIKTLPGSQVEVTFDLNQNDLATFYSKAREKLTANLKISGFRRGKVPPLIAKEHLDQTQVKQEAEGEVFAQTIKRVLAENNLEIISEDDFRIIKNDNKGLTFRATFTIMPEIKLGDYIGLNVERRKVLVDKQEVDQELGDLAKAKTIIKPIETPAQRGNLVEIDYLISLDGEVIKNGKSENHPLLLGENKFVPGFEEQITGMKPGEKKKFKVLMPTDYHNKEISGKEIDVELTLKTVGTVIRPKIDDEFARSAGSFRGIEELRDKIEESLRLKKEAEEKERVRLVILEKISSGSKMVIPTRLVEERLNQMLLEFDQQLHQKGMELGLYLAHLKKSQDDLKKDWQAQAERQVRFGLIIRKISELEKLKVSSEEVDEEFEKMSQHLVSQGQIENLKNINPAELRGRMANIISNERVLDFLEAHN